MELFEKCTFSGFKICVPYIGCIHNGDFYSNPMLLMQVWSMDHTLRNAVLVEIWRILYTKGASLVTQW